MTLVSLLPQWLGWLLFLMKLAQRKFTQTIRSLLYPLCLCSLTVPCFPFCGDYLMLLINFLLIGFYLFFYFAWLQECPAGTYKNVTGSDRSLCQVCPVHELPHRAVYISVRGRSHNLINDQVNRHGRDFILHVV